MRLISERGLIEIFSSFSHIFSYRQTRHFSLFFTFIDSSEATLQTFVMAKEKVTKQNKGMYYTQLFPMCTHSNTTIATKKVSPYNKFMKVSIHLSLSNIVYRLHILFLVYRKNLLRSRLPTLVSPTRRQVSFTLSTRPTRVKKYLTWRGLCCA